MIWCTLSKKHFRFVVLKAVKVMNSPILHKKKPANQSINQSANLHLKGIMHIFSFSTFQTAQSVNSGSATLKEKPQQT